ncbi:hypothetical protein B0H14DRAFT_2792935 [Mycena olivaceomarginata]|nr:hypothetical protein B0H14DRAFT_2792935 [Mycena olivaceomarginata]
MDSIASRPATGAESQVAATLSNALKNSEARNRELESRIKDLENALTRSLEICSACSRAKAGADRIQEEAKSLDHNLSVPPYGSSSNSHPAGTRQSAGHSSGTCQTATTDHAVYDAKAESEHLPFYEYMETLQVPADLPPITALRPLSKPDQMGFKSFYQRLNGFLGQSRPYICAPNRVLWCCGDQHALLFCPTHLYDPLWAEWWLRAPDAAPVGEPRALFVLSGKNIIYVGTYTLLSLRHIRPPGALPPREIARRQIVMSTGAFDAGVLAPDAQIPTECFGLQRVGFDEELYRALVQRFSIPLSVPAVDITVADAETQGVVGNGGGEGVSKKRKRRRGKEREDDGAGNVDVE